MANAYLSANSYLGLIKEATRGTLPASGTPYYIPVTTPQITPTQRFIRDESLRGSPVMVYDQVQGVRHDEVDFKTYLFADTFGVLLASILGGTDTVTATGSSQSHSIPLLNNPAVGSQPPSYSILDFDGANYYTTTGSQANDISITFGADTAADATVKFFANPFTSYTSAPAPFTSLSISNEHMIPAWDTAITIGGTTFSNIQSGELKIDRKTQPIFTMGTQAPLYNFAGPVDVTGKFTAVVNSTSDVFSTGTGATALTRSPQTLVIALTDPNDITNSINHSVKFQMSSVQFQDVKRLRGKEFTEVEVTFTANANTTDAATGYAPITATIVNGTATAFN